MGSKSSSRTSSTNQSQDIVFNNVDNRVIDDEAAVVGGNQNLNIADASIGGDVSVTTTDYGSVLASIGLAQSANDSVENIAKTALEDNSILVNETLTRESILTANALDLLGASFADVAGHFQKESASSRASFEQVAEALTESGRRATQSLTGKDQSDTVNLLVWGLVAVGVVAGGVYLWKKTQG